MGKGAEMSKSKESLLGGVEQRSQKGTERRRDPDGKEWVWWPQILSCGAEMGGPATEVHNDV